MPTFIPKGVCATRIDFEIDDEGLAHNISFINGCPGNAVGVARLAENRPAIEIIRLFEGLPCGHKST
ncbi:MAG: TSCPD domain-containing protein, partial [Coriobacteriales bacterium]|nr:TSCPD domain-containing protein [Coriobacteriales bacterium]